MAEQVAGELAQVLERRDAAQREWQGLSSRSKRDEEAALHRLEELNRLADDLSEQEARGREKEQRQRVVEIETALTEAQASLREVEERLAQERDQLRVLERETLRSRRCDPASKSRVEAMERGERERIAWLARHASKSILEAELANESPAFRRLVEEEIAKVDAERAERREKVRRDAAADAIAHGRDPEAVDRNAVKPGESFQRIS